MTMPISSDQELAVKIAAEVVAACKRKLSEAYEEAGISGLCDEGRWEAALGSLSTIDLEKIVAEIVPASKA